MSRKVNESQKKEILNLFVKGKEIKDISKIFKFTIPTITRQLKCLIGEDEFIRVIRSGDFETFKELSGNKYYFNNPEIIKAYLEELNIFLASKDLDLFVPGLRSLQSKLEKAQFLL